MMEKAGVSFSGYAPGVIGEITRCHAVYYNRHWGFDKTFAALKNKGLGPTG
jgi:hypothetical protein